MQPAKLAYWARHIEPRLLWIFGSPRSGSTWLLQLLGDHSAVIPIDEPLIGLYLSPFASDAQGIDAGSFNAEDFTVRKLEAGKRDHFFGDEFRNVWLPSLASLMRRRFAAQALDHSVFKGKDRRILAIKEPNGSQSADVLMAALPRSRFLFLLRDGRDVVDSELAAHQKGAWLSRLFPGVVDVGLDSRVEFVTQSAQKWLWRTETVQRAYAVHPGPKLTVRYEALLEKPRDELRKIFEWLHLPSNADELAAIVERHSFERMPDDQRGPQEFARAASPGLWRQNLSAEEQIVLEERLAPKLRELGYPA